jgi:hypothetical protein
MRAREGEEEWPWKQVARKEGPQRMELTAGRRRLSFAEHTGSPSLCAREPRSSAAVSALPPA